MSLLSLSAALLFAAGPLPPWMDGRSDPADLQIRVVTFGPGDTLTEWWGHTSLVVTDQRLRDERLYNFGMFGPRAGGSEWDFVADFIKGRLIFWVADEGVQRTFRLYRDFLKRDVRIQLLDLAPEEAQRVATALGTHVLPENRYYRYHHYFDNCSTRPRDIVDAAIGGQLKAATLDASRYTLREQTLRYARVNPPFSVVLDFLQGPMLDKPMTRQGDASLPDELEKQLAALQVKRADGSVRPLVKESTVWFASGRAAPPDWPPNFVPYELLLGLALGALAVGLARWSENGRRASRIVFGLYALLIALVLGIFGGALGFLMAATDHDVTWNNENILQSNPLSLGLIVLAVMTLWGARRAAKWNRAGWALLTALSVLGLLIKVLPFSIQANWNILALTVPVHLGFALAWWKVKRPAAG